MKQGFGYVKYHAFPVFGYEISKTSKLFKSNHPFIKMPLLLNCNFYPNYLMVNDMNYSNYLISEFITDEIKERGYVKYNDIWVNYKMCVNFNDIWNKYYELQIVDELNLRNKRIKHEQRQKEILEYMQNMSKPKQSETKMQKRERMQKREGVEKFLRIWNRHQAINKNKSISEEIAEHQINSTEFLSDRNKITLYDKNTDDNDYDIKLYIVDTMVDYSPPLTIMGEEEFKNFIVGIYPFGCDKKN
jgi:hypothetical protein